jgi:peptide/nickel transport system substrate-binding protein
MKSFRAACAAVAMICAANAGDAAAQTSNVAPNATPKRGGTLNFAITAEPPNYDCHASQTFALLHPIGPHYSLLLKFDAAQNAKIVGDLAESWTVSPDGLTYTFKLHENIKFHDGTALTSQDVKASYDRIRNPPEGVISLRKTRYSDVTAIETPDPRTVVFKLKAPNASMLVNFASPFNCIFSAAKLKANPKSPETEIMGSGAFQFVENVRGSHWTGKRFEGYFKKGLPYLDGYKGFFVKSSAVVPGLIGGQFDAEFRGQNPSERDQLLSKDKDRWTAHESSWSTINIVIFNTTKKPFDDVRVRQALSLALDRRPGGENLSKITIVKSAGGFLRPGYEFALPESELEKLPGFGRDIEKSREEARRLLKEAGVADLKIKLHNRTLAEPYTPSGIFLIDQWRRIGVTAEHSQVETKIYFDNLVSGQFDVALYPVTEPADDPTAQHSYYLTNKLSPISYSRHTDTKLDELFEKQSRLLDATERKKVVHDFERLAITQAYSIPVHWWHRNIVHHKKIKGWHMSASHFQGQDLSGVWLDE